MPAGEGVLITAGGASVRAVVRADGSFSAVLATGGLAASAGAYTIVYSYAGDGNFNFVSNNVTALVVRTNPTDVTAKVAVRLGALQWVAGSNSKSKYNYSQTVTVTNTSGATIAGPFSLELVGLVNATLYNSSGTSKTVNPKSAYMLLSNASLVPGASLTVTLYFYDPTTTTPPRYTAKVIAGGTP